MWLTPCPSFFMAGLPTSFLFCYKITSGPIRMFQTLNYKILCKWQLIFTLKFSNFKEKLRKPCLPDLVSIRIVTFSCQDIGQTHLTHLPRCPLVTISPKFFLRPLSHYFHWSPGHMVIYKLLLANYHFRKHVTLHMIVMSKFPLKEEFLDKFLCVCNL